MDIRNFFFKQKVTETELREGFELAQDADHDLATALGLVGICSGGVGSANVATLAVDLTAGVVYDQLGQRIAWADAQTVDVSRDSAGSVTSVVTPGNERWVSIFAVFVREAGNARVDGNGDEVLYDQDESFSFRVLQGAEAAIGAATRPSLQGDAILLCDVQLEQGQTLLAGGDIDTTRRQWCFPVGSGYGTAVAAITALFASPVSTFATGLVVEETDDEVALLATTDRPTISDYKLILEFPINTSSTVVYGRLYANQAGQGVSLTINARRNNTLNRWEADSTGFGSASEFVFGTAATEGSIVAVHGYTTVPANWTSWPLSQSLYGNEGVWEGDGASKTYAGFLGQSQSVVSTVGVGVPHKKRFLNTPSTVVITPVGSAPDNVASMTYSALTREGLMVVANVTSLNTHTRFHVEVTVS